MKNNISIPEWVNFESLGDAGDNGGNIQCPEWKYTQHTHTQLYLLNHSFKMRSCYFTQFSPIYTHAWQFVFSPLLPPQKIRFASGKDSDVAESRQSRSAQSGNNPRTPVSRQVDDRSGTVLLSQTVLEVFEDFHVQWYDFTACLTNWHAGTYWKDVPGIKNILQLESNVFYSQE